jgi:lambda repressor-like predicted transcriptional regulator
MSQTDRPHLTLELECQIEAALNQIHTLYWPRLEQMQELTSEARDTYRVISPGKIPYPPIPRSPNALKLLLGQYAAALFESEATYYPDGPELVHWLKKLEERVTSMVLDKVAQVEHAGLYRYVTLSYHNVPLPAMQKAISAALEEQSKNRFIAAATEQIKVRLATITPEAVAAAERNRAQRATERKPQTASAVRKAFVDPILLDKGWSILDWANEAEVAYHTAADYLAGTTSPYRSTRVRLAKALGVSPNQLPQ